MKKRVSILMTVLAAVLMLILSFTAAGCFDLSDGDDGSSTGGGTTTTTNSKLEISNVKMVYEYNQTLGYSVKITGTAKNATKKNYSYASVEYSVYDEDGANLGTALDNINNLAAGDTWKFEATLFSFPKTKPATYKLVEITAF